MIRAKPSFGVKGVHSFGEAALQFTGFHLYPADWECLSVASYSPNASCQRI